MRALSALHHCVACFQENTSQNGAQSSASIRNAFRDEPVATRWNLASCRMAFRVDRTEHETPSTAQTSLSKRSLLAPRQDLSQRCREYHSVSTNLVRTLYNNHLCSIFKFATHSLSINSITSSCDIEFSQFRSRTSPLISFSLTTVPACARTADHHLETIGCNLSRIVSLDALSIALDMEV